MKDSNLRKVTAVLSKVIEVISWFGVAMTIMATIAFTVAKDQIVEAYDKGYLTASNITVSGTANNSPEWMMNTILDGGAVFVFAPVAIMLVLTALIFRNVFNIFKASNEASPFSMENVKRIRNIGFYTIAIPICKVICSIICLAVVKSGNYALSVELSEVVFGLVALCLSQYFAYGAELQKDVDGLL